MKQIKCCTIVLVLLVSFVVVGSSTVEAKVVKKTGIYGTLLTKRKNPYDDNAYIKKVKLKKNKIITYGCFYFGKHIWSNKYLKVKKRTFKLSKKCKFLKNYVYPGKEDRTTKKDQYSIIKKFMKKGGGFIYIKVKKGKVVKIMTGTMG